MKVYERASTWLMGKIEERYNRTMARHFLCNVLHKLELHMEREMCIKCVASRINDYLTRNEMQLEFDE